MAETGTPLAARIRRLLETTPREALPLTYHQVADALGLQPPRTIRQVAMALEQTMREDAAADRPLIAALVVSRQGEGLPARGFFDLAVALGRFPDASARHVEAWRAAYRHALASRGHD
ncbi:MULTISPECIES: hypothetical protein [unclassified Modicisalibacter]|uniref:hypothetical protein n=1 Tax=unclassified Modicisalibacter TaxID=2679913 RepID=UPI001CCA6B3F|nr:MULTISPECIES: hypothetical protein [unclassified Modicisalibacter]MBZ9559652.1 hypothetical protein [Modicisalibacter sp. R2A 31.J]MBZ9577104.1 hypothetical protein [Modicisalibacter sp. MOD 31.J]